MGTSRLEVDLRAIDRNVDLIRAVLSAGSGAASARPANLCAVLKQDAYGLGAARIAKRLSAGAGAGPAADRAPGADMFAVYTLDEARQIYEAVPRIPILVLMPVFALDRMDPIYRAAGEGRLHLVLHDHDQLDALTDAASRLGVSLPVHVQVDTGLSRGGETPDAAASLVEAVISSQRLLLSGLLTHFSAPCCDSAATHDQSSLFASFMGDITPTLRDALVAGHNPPRHVRPGESFLGAGGLAELSIHMANSCALFRSRALHGTMARVGQALYGFALEEAHDPAADFEFAD
ncbi:MAG TPA: alanine racemase, partial [Phycisphaerales bacterium]|nr:alanine racemase [Phycisphaerales bacterium]